MKLSQTNGALFPFYNNSVYDTLAHLRRAGFRYVDVSFFLCFLKGSRYWTEPETIIDEYRRAFDELEMTPVQSHEPAGNSIGDDGGEYYMRKTPAAMRIAAEIGVPAMVIHPGMPPVPMTHDEALTRNIEALRRLMPVAEQYHMKLMLENLGCVIVDADDLITVVDEVNHPLLGVNWDVGHANSLRQDQYAEIKKLGARLWGLHIHDNQGAPDEASLGAMSADWHMAPFYGNLNFDAVMTALLEIGYKGAFNFEVDGPKTRGGKIPFYRDGQEVAKLASLPASLRLEADTLLYNIGRYMLQTYDCWEE